MASFWKKFTSGLDFWDKEENRQQREQYAQEDREEEERKRQQRSRQGSSTLADTYFRRPEPNREPETYTTDYSGMGLSAPQKAKQQELDELTQSFLEEEMNKEKDRTSWWDRTLTDRNWDKRAEAAARNKATKTYQDKYGWNRDQDVLNYNNITGQKLEKARNERSVHGIVAPVLSFGRVGTGIGEGFTGLYDLLTPGEGTNRFSDALEKKAEEIDQTAKDFQLEDAYKTGNVGFEIASYFTPAVIGKAGKVGTGLTKYGTKAADAIGDANKYRRFGQRAAQELFDPTNISKEIELTSRYIGQDVVRDREITPQRVAADVAMGVGGATIPALFRGLRRGTGEGVDAGINASRGTRNADEFTGFLSKADDAPSLPGQTVVDDVVQQGQPLGNGISTADLDQPAYQRTTPNTVGQAQSQYDLGVTPRDELFDADSRLIESTPQQSGFEDPLDRPTFQYKDDVDNIMKQANDDFNRYREMHPNATQAELVAVQRRISEQVARAIGDLEQARYGRTSITQIPDASDPIALAKADGAPAPRVADDGQVMAEFNDAQNGSLRKVDAGAGAVDNYGNPAMVSDVQAARQAVEEGRPVQRGGSLVGSEEAARAEEAARVSREQVNRMVEGDAAAPRTREAVSNKILDDNVRADVVDNFNEKDYVNFGELEMKAKERVRALTDEQLVERMSNQPVIKGPQDLFEAVDTVDRLGRLAPDPVVTRALTNAMDAITEFSSESGRRLRAVRELFKNMPGPMKKQYLIDRVEKKLGADLPDLERAELIRLIDEADNFEKQINQIDDVLRQAQNDIELGAPVNETQVRQLINERKSLVRDHEYAQGQAFEYSQALLPKATTGKRVAQGIKTSMLSSPLRRLYDPIVTGITQAADTRDNLVSGYLGKALNKLTGNRGKFRDFQMGDIGTMVKGNLEGVADSKRAIVNDERRIDDMMGELQRATRTDSQGGRRTRAGRLIGDMTEFATEASRGSRDTRIAQIARQEAAQRGLKGDDAKLFAEVTENLLDSNKLHEASEFHLRTNNLHQNKLNEVISGAQRMIEAKFPNGGPIANVLTLPFKSWGSGNITRLLTDKNILYNIGDIAVHLRKDPQRALDSFARLAGNTSEAAVVGFGLSKAGVFSDTDDNGESWGGPFINIGGRKISIAILGPSALPVMAGYNLEQATKDGGFDYDRVRTAAEQALDYSNASSTLAMDNRTSEILTGQGDIEDRLTKAAGDIVRKPIPTVTSDINAVLDQTGLNPTGERAQTRAENEEGNKDYIQTEINKTLNRIPFLSQNLPREEGTSASDIIDRILDSTHGTEASNAARAQDKSNEEKAQSIADRDKSYEEAGVPKTEDGIQAAIEAGDWDKAIQGVTWELQRKADDGEISEKTKQQYERQLTRYGVYKDRGVDAEMVQAYESTTTEEGGVGVTLWRDMMESGDPELVAYAEELYRLDSAIVDSGARKERKYYWKKGGSGGRGGGGGSKGIATNVGKLKASSFNPSFKPEKASFTSQGNTVPQIQPVPVNDTSMRKKITVSRGGR